MSQWKIYNKHDWIRFWQCFYACQIVHRANRLILELALFWCLGLPNEKQFMEKFWWKYSDFVCFMINFFTRCRRYCCLYFMNCIHMTWRLKPWTLFPYPFPLIFYNVNFSFESFLSIRCLICTLLRQFPTPTKTITKLQFHYCLSSLLLELVRIQWQFFCIYFVQIVYMIYEIIIPFSY